MHGILLSWWYLIDKIHLPFPSDLFHIFIDDATHLMWWCTHSKLRDIGSSNHNIVPLNHSSLSACPSWRQILQYWLSACPLSAISLQLPFCTLMLNALEDKHKTRKLTSLDWRWIVAGYVKTAESGKKRNNKCTQWSWLNTNGNLVDKLPWLLIFKLS